MAHAFGRSMQKLTAAVLLVLLAGCASAPGSATRSPPRVDIPEPGSARVVRPPAAETARPGQPGHPSTGTAIAHPAGDAPAPRAESSFSPPDDEAFVIEGEHAAAEEPVVPQSSNRAVNILLAQADGERRGGNLDAAIAAAERALRIAPSDPAAYCQLAELRLERGESAAAEQLARKGLSYGPEPSLRARLEAIIERSRW